MDMQSNSLTGDCTPSQPQQQLHQSAVPTQSSQQQGPYTHSQTLATGQQPQQQMDYTNSNIPPFDYNLSHVPVFYSSDLTTSLHPQQSHGPYSQPLQMNTLIQVPPQQPLQQQQQYQHNSNAELTTRLPGEDNGQSKVMTSKERRQLQNKLSARNFRNRRKEYITSLEEQVDTIKNENTQLVLEIKWVRTTLNKLQKENDDLRVKLALCKGGIAMKQESTLSDRHSSQGLSPPTAIAATTPVPLSPSLSDHPPSVQHTLPTTDTNSSQKPTIATSPLTQNGNSSFTIPDLHGSSHQQLKTQQQHSTSPLASIDSTQQQQPTSRENNRKSNPSILVATSSSSPGTGLETVGTDSSFYHTGHLSLSTDFTAPTNTRDLALPNRHVPLTYALDTTMTHQSLAPPLFENESTFYSLESQQHPASTNQHRLTPYPLQGQHTLPPSSSLLQPPNQRLEYTTTENTTTTTNNSYVSTAVIPDFDFGSALDKQQQVVDSSLLWKYPLLVPAFISMIIDYTMSMSADELLSHTRVLSAPSLPPAPPTQHLLPAYNSGLKPYLGSNRSMAPGLRYTSQYNRPTLSTDVYPLSKKQLDAMWGHLLGQMKTTPSLRQQKALETTTMTDSGTDGNDDDSNQDFWYDAPVTGFKSICPLYWMQRQLCRFVITYVIVKYPQLEMPCKTYLPICEQFRQRLITTP